MCAFQSVYKAATGSDPHTFPIEDPLNCFLTLDDFIPAVFRQNCRSAKGMVLYHPVRIGMGGDFEERTFEQLSVFLRIFLQPFSYHEKSNGHVEPEMNFHSTNSGSASLHSG